MAILNVEAVALQPNDLGTLQAMGLRLRDWDERAIAVLGLTPVEAIAHCASQSAETIAVFADGALCAVWGHGSKDFIAGTGFAWLVTTPEVEAHKMRFALNAWRVVNYLMSLYVRLEVLIDAEHLVSLGWLERMGFEKYPQAFVMNAHPFMLLWKDRKCPQ